MNISSIKPPLDAAEIPPEQLAGNKRLTEEQKIGEISRQFEALLLRQILQNTQKTVIPSALNDNSTAAGIYHDLVTERLADSISKSGTVGLAKMLQVQLSHQLHPASSAGHENALEARPTSPSKPGSARPASSGSPQAHALNPQLPVKGHTILRPHE